MRRFLQAHFLVEQFRRVDEGVAVETAHARKFCFFQTGDGAQQVGLRGIFELGLKPDHVPQCPQRIVLSQLDHGIGAFAGVRVGEADGFHRTEAQCFGTARGHYLDRHAAFEIGRVLFPLLEIGLFALEQSLDEGVILFAVHRAVDIILAVAFRPDLVPARLHPGDVHVDAVLVDNRRNGIEKGQRVLAGGRTDALGQRHRRQGAGGDDGQSAFGQLVDPFADDLDIRMVGEPLADSVGKMIAVDSQRRTGRQAMLVAFADDDRVEVAHFLMEQADGIFLGIVRAEAVGADQFGQLVGLVGRRHLAAPAHLGKAYFRSVFRQLPCCFRPGEPAAYDMYICHARLSVVVRR